MAWANQKVYAAIQTLPDQALSAYLINPEWTAGHILQHIVGGADWYQHCLTGDAWREIADPKSMNDVASLAKLLAKFDAKIAMRIDLPDDFLTITEGEKSWQNLRSTLLAEVIYHATEHRAQLMDALESKGYAPISLDEIDLWAFEKFEKFEKESS